MRTDTGYNQRGNNTRNTNGQQRGYWADTNIKRPNRDNSKQQPNQVKYTKSFDTFEDGMEELIDILAKDTSILSFIPSVENGYNEIDIKQDMINVVSNNVPSIYNKDNIYFDLSVSATKCSLKTNKSFAFGWFSTKDRNTGKITYIFHTVLFGTIYDDIKIDLQNNDWIKEQPRNTNFKQSENTRYKKGYNK